MQEEILSVITNFGCHGRCPYCVVRENGIDVPKTTLEGLDNLGFYLKKYNSKLISVSGGGDPLHNYREHKDYYSKLSDILNNNNCRLELHTSYINSDFPYSYCERVVYHLLDIKQLNEITRHGNEIVRAVFVVEDKFTIEDINTIAKFCKDRDSIDELSFRQLIGNDYKTQYHLHDYLKAGHKKDWYYIEQSDYNLYYVEGKIYTKFADIKGDK